MEIKYEKRQDVVSIKSFEFALHVIEVCKDLKTQKEFELANQFLRSGTSIGANISEAQFAQTKKDFIHKFSIAQKEVAETIYWINLLIKAKIIESKVGHELMSKSEEIMRIVTAILKSSKRNLDS